MFLSTTHEIPSYEIDEPLEIVYSDVTPGINFVKDMMLKVTDTLGGRSKTMEKAIGSAREKATKDLIDQAIKIDADGIIGISYSISIHGKENTMFTVSAVGTAVKLKDKVPQSFSEELNQEANNDEERESSKSKKPTSLEELLG